jgi:hypothetical protein
MLMVNNPEFVTAFTPFPPKFGALKVGWFRMLKIRPELHGEALIDWYGLEGREVEFRHTRAHRGSLAASQDLCPAHTARGCRSIEGERLLKGKRIAEPVQLAIDLHAFCTVRGRMLYDANVINLRKN